MWRVVGRHSGLRSQARRCSEWATSPIPTGGSHTDVQDTLRPFHRLGAQSVGNVLANALRRELATSTLHQVKAAPATTKAAASEQVQGILETLRQCCHSYYFLSKARLSLMVATTASAGFVMASPEQIDWAKLGWTTTGTFLAAASANTCNQLLEAASDACMKRTAQRPLPAGRISAVHAAMWALASGGAGVTILYYKTNELTAALGAANIALYAGVYTPLKVLHHLNTWVGAVVGAIPPIMGWTAVTGQIDPGAGVLAAVLYFWQIPHFLSLAWMLRKDYTTGRYRMLSQVDPTGFRVAAPALRNSLYLLPLGAVAVTLGCTSLPFFWENLAVSGALSATALHFYQTRTTQSARTLFRASLIHLPVMMVCMLAHRIPHVVTVQQGLTEEEMRLLKEVVEEYERGEEDSETDTKEDPGILPVPNTAAAPFPFLPAPHC